MLVEAPRVERMSLLSIHKVFIALAILLSVGFTVSSVATGDGGALAVLRGAASAMVAVALGLYLGWLVRGKARVIDAATASNARRRDKPVQS
jgi:hypothetical protein